MQVKLIGYKFELYECCWCRLNLKYLYHMNMLIWNLICSWSIWNFQYLDKNIAINKNNSAYSWMRCTFMMFLMFLSSDRTRWPKTKSCRVCPPCHRLRSSQPRPFRTRWLCRVSRGRPTRPLLGWARLNTSHHWWNVFALESSFHAFVFVVLARSSRRTNHRSWRVSACFVWVLTS